MLVIERVPLQLVAQVAGVHDLEHQHAVFAERLARRGQDPLGMIVVSECVAARHDVGASGALANCARGLDVEVAGHDVEALGTREIGDVPRGVDADRGDAGRLQRRQQNSVVTAELDHHTRRQPFANGGGIRAKMFDQRSDRARRERIVLEQDLGIDWIQYLDQPARRAGDAPRAESGAPRGSASGPARKPPASGCGPKSSTNSSVERSQPRQVVRAGEIVGVIRVGCLVRRGVRSGDRCGRCRAGIETRSAEARPGAPSGRPELRQNGRRGPCTTTALP